MGLCLFLIAVIQYFKIIPKTRELIPFQAASRDQVSENPKKGAQVL